jgi:hypothetical protein
MDWAFHESQVHFDIRTERDEYEDYSSTQQEFCKIGLRGAGTATGPDGPLFPRGKRST